MLIGPTSIAGRKPEPRFPHESIVEDFEFHDASTPSTNLGSRIRVNPSSTVRTEANAETKEGKTEEKIFPRSLLRAYP